VQEALDAMRHGLPFRLLGIDSDNGSEFLNAHFAHSTHRDQPVHAIMITGSAAS